MDPSSGSRHTRTWSLEIGDYIGMESCIDLENDVVADEDERVTAAESGRRSSGDRRREWRRREKKEFPPPISLLARTENLQSHMPWVLKRCYSDDGRLIIWEEKVRHHEYIRADRSNGRLTLQLIPLDNPVPDDDDDEMITDEVHEDDDGGENGEQCSDDDVVVVKEEEKAAVTVVSGGGGKCYNNYSGVRSNPCMYGMAVPSIRPVHI